jgi:hypothetical protein
MQDSDTQRSLEGACSPQNRLQCTFYPNEEALLKRFVPGDASNSEPLPFTVVIDLRLEGVNLQSICSTIARVAPEMRVYAYYSNSERVSDQCFKAGVTACFKGTEVADLLTTIALLE